jgi:hypothetical protein
MVAQHIKGGVATSGWAGRAGREEEEAETVEDCRFELLGVEVQA